MGNGQLTCPSGYPVAPRSANRAYESAVGPRNKSGSGRRRRGEEKKSREKANERKKSRETRRSREKTRSGCATKASCPTVMRHRKSSSRWHAAGRGPSGPSPSGASQWLLAYPFPRMWEGGLQRNASAKPANLKQDGYGGHTDTHTNTYRYARARWSASIAGAVWTRTAELSQRPPGARAQPWLRRSREPKEKPRTNRTRYDRDK